TLLSYDRQLGMFEELVTLNSPLTCARVKHEIMALETLMNTVNTICILTKCDMEPILDTEEKAKVLDMANPDRILAMRRPADMGVPLADIVARWYFLFNDSCQGCRNTSCVRLQKMWPAGLTPTKETIDDIADSRPKLRNCVTCGQPWKASSN